MGAFGGVLFFTPRILRIPRATATNRFRSWHPRSWHRRGQLLGCCISFDADSCDGAKTFYQEIRMSERNGNESFTIFAEYAEENQQIRCADDAVVVHVIGTGPWIADRAQKRQEI